MNGWAYLGVAGLLEVVWAIALKQSDGLNRLVPSVISLAAAALSFVLLGRALETLPVGIAYAAWVGIGTAGVAILGITLLGESASIARLACVTLILTGVTGLYLVER